MENNTIKILCIDDNTENLLVTKSMIQTEFPTALFLTALNGETGLEIALEEDPDVILLDVLMPKMNGYEVCKKLKANDKLVDIPVAFITNVEGTNEIRIRAMEAGAAAYLVKPIEMKLLGIQIKALLKVKVENVAKRNEKQRLALLVEERTSELLENNKTTLALLEDLKKENEARKSTEAALRASKDLYHSVVNASPDYIMVTDLEGSVLFLSPSISQMGGYENEEDIIGRNILDFVAPQDQQRVKNNMESILNGELFEVAEYQLLKSDGTVIETEINTDFTRDENGHPTGVVFVIKDIRNQKFVEKELHESENKYRFITEKITDVVWLMDLNGKSLFVSQSVENFTGYSAKEYLSQNLAEKFTPESAAIALKALRDEVLLYIQSDIQPEKYKKTIYLDYQCKNGEVKTGEVIVTPYLDENNALAGLHGVTRDVTKRKQMEKALRENEERYRIITEQSPIAIELYDAEGILVNVNKACLELFGVVDEKELKGFSLFDDPNVSEDHKIELKQGMSINYQSEFNFDLVKELNLYQTTKSGVIFIDTIITPVKMEEQVETGYLVQIQDVTGRKNSDKNIRHVARLYALLSEINKAIINCKNQETLFDTICKVAIEYGQFRMGWFGIYDEVVGRIIPKTSAGYTNGYLDLLQLDPNSQTNGKGPTGSAFNEGRIVFCNDIANDPMMRPWRDEALKRDYQSSFAAPIFRGGKPYGTLTLYASEAGFFNKDEQKLLADIGQNISFAIDALDSEMERKQIQLDLQISELKYRDLMENSPEGITIYVDGRIAYVNKEAMKLMKAAEKEELMGKSIIDFIHPSNREMILERMKLVAMAPLNSILPSVEEKYIRLDGQEIDVEIKVMPILFEGKPAIQLVGHDISDRKKAEFVLADTMTELKAIYDSAPVMMCVVDENADIQFANHAFAQLSEVFINELKGEQVGDVLGCIQALENNAGCGFGNLCGQCGLRGAMLNTLHTGVGQKNIEHKSTLVRNGVKVDVYLLASTALIFNGDAKRLLLCLVDISVRKEIEVRLKLSEEKYRLLAENMHDGIVYSSADQTINYISQSYIKQLGYTHETEFASSLNDLYSIIHPDDRDEFFRKINSAIENKSPQLTYSLKIKHAKGHYIWCEDSAKFNYDEYGNYVSIYIVSRDITKRKQIEEALKISESRLQNMFEYAPISIWEEDLSLVKRYFDELKSDGIQDFRAYFTNNKEAIQKALDLINVVAVNQTTLKLFDVEEKDDMLKNLYLKVDDVNIKVLEEEFIALAEGKIRFEGETQIITIKGAKKDLLLTLTVMPGYEDSLSKVLISFIDITDRKKAEEDLQKSEMFLRTFIENSPFEIWARDVNDFGILENKKFLDHYGSIIGKKTIDDIIQDIKMIKKWEKNNERILQGEVIEEVADLIVNKKKRTYQQISFPIYNKLDIIGIAGFNIDITERKHAEEALRKSQVQLKQFAAHLQDVREDEKKLLAREIHDELGQILVALKIDLGLLRQKVFKKLENDDQEDVVTKFDHLYGLVDDTIKTTRKIMTNLRPEVLDLLGFIDTVKQYCKEYQERHKISCQLFCNITKIEINSQQAVALFRIVQESLTNVVKHAQATSVIIRIESIDDKLVMEIVDNGVGFDDNHKGRTDSYGMIGMKERVFLLEGELKISTEKEKGTSVRVEMPYEIKES